jgi:tRNA-Thr(GGU) m(6)t(6)A37 methyltransferase TsaA
MSFTIEPIGVIRSTYTDVFSTPIQSMLNADARGQLVVYEPFVAGLRGLEDFDYALLITLLSTERHTDEGILEPVPLLLRGTARRIGVFATRFPIRPNSLGLSLVRVHAVGRATVDFSGVDMINGTPVLDIKPWVPAFDLPADRRDVRIGWYTGIDLSSNKDE